MAKLLNLLLLDSFLLAETVSSLASAAAGGAVGIAMMWLLRSAGQSKWNTRSPYEAIRQERMRQQNWTYRTFQRRIDTLGRLLDKRTDDPSSPLQRALGCNDMYSAWKAREFLACKIVEGVFAGFAVLVIVSLTGYWKFAMFLGGGLCLLYPWLSRSSMITQAEIRLKRQRLRLPFVIDQIALMMQAGANFEESLASIAAEDPDHPLTEELRAVLADIQAGRTRPDALNELKQRIPDAEVGELIRSIVNGEELGTPLSKILSEQADQMRIKRAQWGEKAAAEAEVQIVFPGMLVMIACLIVVLGPIMLPAVMNLLGPSE